MKSLLKAILPQRVIRGLQVARTTCQEWPQRRQWHQYRRIAGQIRHESVEQVYPPRKELSQEPDAATKEARLQRCLEENQVNSFLEVGIGEWPHFERLKWFAQKNIAYSACDFKDVCEVHRIQTEAREIDSDSFRYLGNSHGSYSWTLFELMEKGEQFDAIYIDGHHTFLVDLPAFFLADRLLRPGGVMLIDDIRWTLDFVAQNMAKNFGEWQFYHRIYDRSQYSEAQCRLPHMRIIAESLILNELKYALLSDYSSTGWYVTKKPST